MNIAPLEAYEDVREAFLVGSVFGGDEGKQYLELLNETAWYLEPERIEKSQKLLDAAEAHRGNLKGKPDGH